MAEESPYWIMQRYTARQLLRMATEKLHMEVERQSIVNWAIREADVF